MRTDIAQMTASDLETWIMTLTKEMNPKDIEIIHRRLGEELVKYSAESTKGKRVKICDKCMKTYPFHTTNCQCGNDKLRIIN
jgi:ribosomal protein L40E